MPRCGLLPTELVGVGCRCQFNNAIITRQQMAAPEKNAVEERPNFRPFPSSPPVLSPFPPLPSLPYLPSPPRMDPLKSATGLGEKFSQETIHSVTNYVLPFPRKFVFVPELEMGHWVTGQNWVTN